MDTTPRLRTLEDRHAKLDGEIAKDAVSPFSGQMEVSRKKKLKLSLKDGIEGMSRDRSAS